MEPIAVAVSKQGSIMYVIPMYEYDMQKILPADVRDVGWKRLLMEENRRVPRGMIPMILVLVGSPYHRSHMCIGTLGLS